MGFLALACFVLLLIMVPNEVWAVLLYIGLIGLVGVVGFGAFLIWVTTLA